MNNPYNNKNNSSNLYYQYNRAEYSQEENYKKQSSIKKALTVTIIFCLIISLLAGLSGGVLAGIYLPKATRDKTPGSILQNQADKGGDNEQTKNNTPIYSLSEKGKTYSSISQIYAEKVDATVGIVVEKESSSSFWNASPSTSSGSGVIISEDGYIVTNNHVIEGAKKIWVYPSDNKPIEASLIGTDAQMDIAVLKIDYKGLDFLTLGDSDKILVGEQILVIGNPLGYLHQSLTVGYISGLQREIILDNEKMTLIQTDAAVNPGNSGGAMLNLGGELIGIINAKSYGNDIDGIGFAIPINDVKKILDDIISFGYVTGRPYIGVSIGEILDKNTLNWYNMMYSLELTDIGTYITRVEEDTPAFRGGLKEWDRIISFNGTKVESPTHLKELIDECTVGQVVEVLIVRAGGEKTLTLTIGERTPYEN